MAFFDPVNQARVTDADEAAERAVSITLETAYPGAVVIGEEARAKDSALLDAIGTADLAATTVRGEPRAIGSWRSSRAWLSDTPGGHRESGVQTLAYGGATVVRRSIKLLRVRDPAGDQELDQGQTPQSVSG